MILFGVECEKTSDIAAESYVCRWGDRHKLELGFLGQGKGSRTTDHAAIEGAPGIMSRRFALIIIESYPPA